MTRSRDWLRRSALCFGVAALCLMPLGDATARRGDKFSVGGGGGHYGGGSHASNGGNHGGGSSHRPSSNRQAQHNSREQRPWHHTSTGERPQHHPKKVAQTRYPDRQTSKNKQSEKQSQSKRPTKTAQIYVPPKPPKRNPPYKPPRPPKPPVVVKYPPTHPKPPRGRPPVIVVTKPPIELPTTPVYVPPPVTVVTAPPTLTGPGGGGGSYLPPAGGGGGGSAPSARPRRMPMTVPPVATLNRSREREIIIAMDGAVNDGDTITLGQGFQLTVEVQYASALLELKIVRLRIPDNRSRQLVIEQVIQAGLADPRIITVQPNYVFQTSQGAARAALAPLPQYAAEKVRLGEAHRVSMGRNVRVAVIDTGLDAEHPELSGAIAESFDAIGEGPSDIEAHGTAIAGIVAAHQQIVGMAPDARVLAVRAFSNGSGARLAEATTLSLIKGLDWAAAHNARVVNMSFAGPNDPLLQAAVERAEAKGMIMVAAAGNGGPKAEQAYPAAFEGVIAVTASDSDDQLYDKANRGNYVAVAAPGVDILTPAPEGAYEMSSGTSLAAAHVSGIIALMLERRPGLTTEAIRSILSRTARDPDKSAASRGLGAGIVDAARAVEESR